MRRTLVFLVCLSALAGCTSSGKDERDTLTSVLLQLSDFPPSWRSFSPSASQVDVLGGLANCTGDDRGAQASVASVRSGEFRNGRQRITSMAVAFDSQHAVSQRVAAIGDTRANSCLAKVLRTTVLGVDSADSVIASHYTVIPGGINVAVNLVGTAEGVVTVSADGNLMNVYVDIAFITGRNFYSDVTFIGLGRRISLYVRNALIGNIAQRAQQT
jgi:hypothetical protein